MFGWHSLPIPIDARVAERFERLNIPFSRYGVDPYGIDKSELAKFLTVLGWAYDHYFRVTTRGIEHIPPSGRAMLVGNHSGGWALDAAMVVAAAFFALEPPRLAQGMAEKFLGRFPFASAMTAKIGQFTGLPRNAERLLNDERLLMVFPEGARGTAKLYPQRDSLVRFGTGFCRLALATRTPIVPFAFVGGGEAIPTIANLQRLGRLIGVPYVPLTPYLVPLPLPVALVLEFGEPMQLEGTGTEPDDEVDEYVEEVKRRIEGLVRQGRALRQGAAREGA